MYKWFDEGFSLRVPCRPRLAPAPNDPMGSSIPCWADPRLGSALVDGTGRHGRHPPPIKRLPCSTAVGNAREVDYARLHPSEQTATRGANRRNEGVDCNSSRSASERHVASSRRGHVVGTKPSCAPRPQRGDLAARLGWISQNVDLLFQRGRKLIEHGQIESQRRVEVGFPAPASGAARSSQMTVTSCSAMSAHNAVEFASA